MAVDEIRVEDKPLDKSDTGLIFTPVGDMPQVSIILHHKLHRWRIESHSDGTVSASSIDA